MKRISISILAGVLLLTACGTEKGFEIHSTWTRPAAQGENGAVYFVIHNHSSTADELVGASSNIAEAVEM
ncbi:MAG TPA: copper chaperone PCu(A)C, partial [Anaerolineales bacterium]|nr:copper chaperone PCu(A)C [Anaerolineales bacterium]